MNYPTSSLSTLIFVLYLLQSVDNESSKCLSELDDFALASLQLVTMEATVKMSSNNQVELQASMKDIALSDKQKERQSRTTGYLISNLQISY